MEALMSKGHVRLLAVGLMAVTALWATSVFALSPQTVWTRTYGGTGGEFGLSVQQTSDGGYIIAGETSSFGAGSHDAYLIKTDAGGDTVWTRTFGGPGSEFGNSVQQTSDGGYIVAGETTSFGAGSGDAYLMKMDADGDTVWIRTYGGTGWDDGNSVQQTSDGGYIITGDTDSFGAGGKDAYLIKTDADGDTLWTRTYGGTGEETGWSVQQTSDGGYIIAGDTDSFGAGSYDVYLIKTDASGDTVWTRTYGGTGVDLGGAVQQTSDGGYIFAGMTDSFGAGSYDMYLIRMDASGDTVWTRTYGGAGVEAGGSVQQASDGGYVFTGYTSSFGAGSEDVYLVRTDASGDVVWTRTYGGTGEDAGVLVQQTSNGRYIIIGYTDSFGAGGYDVYLLRVREHNWNAKDEKMGPGPPKLSPRSRKPMLTCGDGMSARLTVDRSCPNPFSEATLIRFDLPEQGEINLSIHDVQGRLVRELVCEVRSAGSHSVAWNGRDFTGAEVVGGIYFVHLQSGGKVSTGKVVVSR
jgi:hypothetical protein